MPRLAPVTSTALPAIVLIVSSMRQIDFVICVTRRRASTHRSRRGCAARRADRFTHELGFAHLIAVHRGLNAAGDAGLHPLRAVPRWTWPGDGDQDEFRV
jgi:hypothetical protein